MTFCWGSPRVKVVERWITPADQHDYHRLPTDADGDMIMQGDEELDKEDLDYQRIVAQMLDEGMVTNFST